MKWMNYRQIADTARDFAAGMQKLNLVPDIDVASEGKAMRFIGIQAKNRKEWCLVHLANMHLDVTTVALYDTLGE